VWYNKNMNDKKIQIDIELEACEIAIKNAYARTEVEDLEGRIIELLKIRKELVSGEA
jgi:hypothetical protein